MVLNFSFLGIFSLCLGMGFSIEINCDENPDFYKTITGRYDGQPGVESVLILPCDTMIVPKNKEAVIDANTFVHFLKPRQNNIIIVEGSLTIAGRENEYCTISNGIDSSDSNVLFAVRSPWQGFEVGEKGKLVLHSTLIYGTRIPIRSKSENVTIDNTLFYRSDFASLKSRFVLFFSESGVITHFSFKKPSTNFTGRNSELVFNSPTVIQPDRKSNTVWYLVSGGLLIGSGITTLFLATTNIEINL